MLVTRKKSNMQVTQVAASTFFLIKHFLYEEAKKNLVRTFFFELIAIINSRKSMRDTKNSRSVWKFDLHRR